MAHLTDLTVHRGSVLHFLGDPGSGIEPVPGSHEYFEDGALAIADGKVVAVGPASDLLARYPRDVRVVEHGRKLLLPGFIDTHIHYPQTDVIASAGRDHIRLGIVDVGIDEPRQKKLAAVLDDPDVARVTSEQIGGGPYCYDFPIGDGQRSIFEVLMTSRSRLDSRARVAEEVQHTATVHGEVSEVRHRESMREVGSAPHRSSP